MLSLATLLGSSFAWIMVTSLNAQAPSGLVTANGRYLMRSGIRFELHGENYYPKDYAWNKFWTNYITATAQISAEMDLSKALGVNTVRIFLPYNLFTTASPYLVYLKDFVNQIESRHMVAIITLFDFYPSLSPNPYSPTDYLTNTAHISSVINALGITNTTVLGWDIKNELDRDYDVYGKNEVTTWAHQMISYTRQVDPNHLVTIGFYGAVTTTTGLVYSPTIAAEFASAVDFVSLHYFLSEHQFESDLQALRARVGEKPIVLEEFGLHTLATPTVSCVISPTDPNCDDPHTEAEQAAYYNALLSLSEAQGIVGYLFWTLNDFSYILTGTQESHHCQGILRNSLVPDCQITTTANYAEKLAADVVRQHYGQCYLDLFNGWAVADAELPVPGWTENWIDGGAYFRGYKPSNIFWSHDTGKVAFSKFVSGSLAITGTATSPLLMDVNIDQCPVLAGQVYSYSIRDSQYGTGAILYVGVKEGTQITRSLTVTSGTLLPYNFLINLRQPPIGWSGTRDFQVVLELVPETPNNGYSATYELDWIGVGGSVSYLPLIMRNYP